MRNYYGKTPGSSTANLILAFHLGEMKVTATFPPTLTILVWQFLYIFVFFWVVVPGIPAGYLYADVIWLARLILFRRAPLGETNTHTLMERATGMYSYRKMFTPAGRALRRETLTNTE